MHETDGLVIKPTFVCAISYTTSLKRTATPINAVPLPYFDYPAQDQN